MRDTSGSTQLAGRTGTRRAGRIGACIAAVAAAVLMTAAPAQAATPAALVARTLVSPADIPVTFRVVPPRDGWQGDATVDAICAPKATTERFRRARQVLAVVTGQETMDSPSALQEVVAYDTAARATLAMKEWRAAGVRCATFTFTIFGTTYTSKSAPMRSDASLPVTDNTVETTTMTSSLKGDPPGLQFVVVQRHGQVLNVVRGYGSLRDKERVIRNTMRIARNTGRRQATGR